MLMREEEAACKQREKISKLELQMSHTTTTQESGAGRLGWGTVGSAVAEAIGQLGMIGPTTK